REQAQQHLERDRQRGTGRGGARLAGGGVAVGALLGQLDVVVAERPEERFDDLEAARVVQLVEGGGGLLDDLGQLRQQRAVQRIGDHRRIRGQATGGIGGSLAEAERELRGVEDLDRQAATDLHL